MTKEDFNKFWKDSTRERILNQYYYDYQDLRKCLKILDKIKEVINYYAVEDEDYSKIYNQEEQDILELLEEIE